MFALIAQHLQHAYVVRLTPRLLQYPPVVRDNNGVGSDDNGWLAALWVVEFGPVDIERFGRRRLEHVVQGAQRVV